MKGSFVDIISKLGVLAVAALMVFAFYTLFIDKPFYEEGSYGFDRDSREVDSGTIDADRTVDSIEVRNISGRIYAEGWDEDFVRLDYRKFGPGEPPEVAVDYSGDRMIIKAVYPKRPAAFGSVDFELKIPENVTLVEAGTVSGAVKISASRKKPYSGCRLHRVPSRPTPPEILIYQASAAPSSFHHQADG